ncbi:hypothetical protein DITRI_Ditri06bG0099600 [Diplodiscus trichospermus]
MASVFLYHVVGDLTVGKPKLVELSETETVESAVRTIGESTECGIPVWKRRSHAGMIENNEMRQQRFVGILMSLDIVFFFARTECSEDQEKAMKTEVSDVVVPNNAPLKIVNPTIKKKKRLLILAPGDVYVFQVDDELSLILILVVEHWLHRFPLLVICNAPFL